MVTWIQAKDWLKVWAPVISETLAALAIIAAAFTYVWSAYKSKNVDINASILVSRSNGLSLLVTNSGGVDLALRRAKIHIDALGRDEHIRLDESELLVPRGSSKIIVSAPSDLFTAVAFDPYLDKAKSISQGKCTITLQFATADGSSVPPIQIPLSCIKASVKRE